MSDISNQTPNIFNYDDHRLFFRDYYRFKKSEGAHFSFRYFSRRAGYTSSATFKLVMDGKRNLTIDGVERFAKALGLTPLETEHLHKIAANRRTDGRKSAGLKSRQLPVLTDHPTAAEPHP